MKPRHFATRLAASYVLPGTLTFFVACAGSEDEAEKGAPQPPPFPVQPNDGGGIEATIEEPPVTPKKCSDDGFCYVPVPGTSALSGVSASSADDAWMITDQGGALMRWDGTAIRQVYDYDRASPPSIAFFGIWAEKKDDVWAVARGSDDRVVIVRYASPVGGGAPAFRELRTDISTRYLVPTSWAPPTSDVLWIAAGRNVYRVHEDASGAVVEDLTPPKEAAEYIYAWDVMGGFAADDVYVGGTVCKSVFCNPQVGALAHYDGTTWSLSTIDTVKRLSSLQTTPGPTRQLWYTTVTQDLGKYQGTAHLAPIESDDRLGADLYTRPENLPPPCGVRVGRATAASTGWFSAGTLLCRWNGTALEPVQTALEDRPIISLLKGIWASGADDVWIVGAAVTRGGLPQTPFAARRTAATAEEAKQ